MFCLAFPHTSKWHLYPLGLETEEWGLIHFPFFGLDHILIPFGMLSQSWGFSPSLSYSVGVGKKSSLQAP